MKVTCRNRSGGRDSRPERVRRIDLGCAGVVMSVVDAGRDGAAGRGVVGRVVGASVGAGRGVGAAGGAGRAAAGVSS